VEPFLKNLKCSWFFSVQQLAICGIPDKVGVCCGRFVALELKRSGGKATALQLWTIEQINKCGGYAVVVDPETWPVVRSKLTRLDAGEEIE
jgi:hypothetical protein